MRIKETVHVLAWVSETDSNQSYHWIIKSLRTFLCLHDHCIIHWTPLNTIYDAQEVWPCFPHGLVVLLWEHHDRTDLCCFHLVQATQSTHFSCFFTCVCSLGEQLSLDMFGSKLCMHGSLFRVAWAAAANQLLLRFLSQWPCRIPGWLLPARLGWLGMFLSTPEVKATKQYETVIFWYVLILYTETLGLSFTFHCKGQ